MKIQDILMGMDLPWIQSPDTLPEIGKQVIILCKKSWSAGDGEIANGMLTAFFKDGSPMFVKDSGKGLYNHHVEVKAWF